MNKRRDNILTFLMITAGSILLSLVFTYIGIQKENHLMLYIIGVLLIARQTHGYLYGLGSAAVMAIAFNYFFTEPLNSFRMNDPNDLLFLLFFLLASFIACNLTDRFQKQLTISRNNEEMSNLLYQLSDTLLNVSGEEEIVGHAVEFIRENLGIEVEIQRGQEIANGSYPITGMNGILGCIILPVKNYSVEHDIVMKALANQIANALDRELTYKKQEETRIQMEREHTINSMLRSISHDLRTPLTGIAGAAQILSGRTLTKDEVAQFGTDIYEQTKWLDKIVENILSMSKIDSGALTIVRSYEVIDDLIDEAVNLLPKLNERHFVVHSPEQPVLVHADGKLIVQVLVNLLDNALKFTMPEDTIEVRSTEKENVLEVEVRDTGVKISEEILDRVFDEFVTTPGISADAKEGIGLGLAICKAVIEAHGGQIHARNNDTGCSFIFTLPLEVTE